MERIKRWRAEPTRSSRVHRQVNGGRRLRAVVATGAMVAVALPVVSSDAAVGGRRSIEVTTTSDLVILEGFPRRAQVKIKAFRGGVLVGFATKRVQPDGTLELNHVGGTDCWESDRTPNLRPGDRIRTKIVGTQTIDSMIVRGLFIDNVDRGATSVTVSGHVRLTGRTGVPSGPLELRLRTDSDDVREDIRPVVSDTGTWSHTFNGIPSDEVAGAEAVLEWIGGGNGELTVAEEPGPAQRLEGCPPVERE